jgi:lipopolysaccharide transport system permease protein
MVAAASRTVVYDARPVTAAGWFRELVQHRELLYMIAWREIKVKYKQSVMGFLWAILIPMVIVAAGVLVRYAFAVVSGREVAAGDLAGVAVKAVPWAFFVSTIRFASVSLVANTNLVTKIYMPREVFPLASVLSGLLDFGVASATLIVILGVARIGVSVHLLWLPLLVVILVLLTVALALLLSAASLFFRDVKYIVEVLLTFGIFFTPVFYDVGMFGHWAPLLLLNPLAPVLEGFAAVVVRHASPDLPWLAYAAALGVAGSALGITFFKRLEPFFAESV